MRLNQYLAKCKVASRRKAEKYIKKAKVSINNQITKNPYCQIKKNDQIKLNNVKIEPAKNIYILVNKPAGITSTCFDKFAKKTILDLIPQKIISRQKRIYPVGRLDKNSTGLIMLTNDGEFCYKVTHPKFKIEKEYIVTLLPAWKKDDCQKAKNGVKDKEDMLKVKEIKSCQKKNIIKVTLAEGKKRHLRRLFGQLGYQVKSLKRTRIAYFKLGKLKEGEFKIINWKKIKKLKEKNA